MNRPSARPATAALAATTAAAALLGLAACTSTSTSGQPTSAPTTSSAPTTAAPTSATPTTPTTPASTSAAAPSSSAPDSSSASQHRPRPTATTSPTGASSTPVAAGPPPCPNGTVATTITRGSALPGEEIAVLTFTNRSSSSCTLTGFPGVELLRHGAVLGKPARRSSQPATTLTVRPGRSVTARLTDDTRCNAPLSDHAGVYVPNQTEQVQVAVQLRGCTLTIDPVRR